MDDLAKVRGIGANALEMTRIRLDESTEELEKCILLKKISELENQMQEINKNLADIDYINTRKEFFRVSLDEIEKVVKENYDGSAEFIKTADAEQYRESERMRTEKDK